MEWLFVGKSRIVPGIGSVYSALDRMEQKGFVSSTVGDPTPERGGKAKRYYRMERAGVLALQRARDMFAQLWDGLVLDEWGAR
jgi:DNA-binding PadR family transcriptional regulator